MDILTDAGFTTDEAKRIVDRLIEGVDNRTDQGPDRIDVESLSPEKQQALNQFTLAVAADN
ncbi:hypothetical protein [Micromonospora sagamiensis]|uniref:hypothetical protein n=1 Tax=Micromonospora sagamiensis TaxID=47875 RepID=UPI0011A88681|nr:hypothetical protein [Micromonospora sagamiensis]BCL15916.1 hypothetical protein GCM10017556_36550 [Micromonospora sagamiensis]